MAAATRSTARLVAAPPCIRASFSTLCMALSSQNDSDGCFFNTKFTSRRANLLEAWRLFGISDLIRLLQPSPKSLPTKHLPHLEHLIKLLHTPVRFRTPFLGRGVNAKYLVGLDMLQTKQGLHMIEGDPWLAEGLAWVLWILHWRMEEYTSTRNSLSSALHVFRGLLTYYFERSERWKEVPQTDVGDSGSARSHSLLRDKGSEARRLPIVFPVEMRGKRTLGGKWLR